MTALIAVDLEQPPPSLAIREEEFCAWVGQATPGQRLEYYRGRLAIDRARGFSPFGEKLRRELDALAHRVLALSEEGRLMLVQQRHGAGDYSYLAVMATRPHRQGRSSG